MTCPENRPHVVTNMPFIVIAFHQPFCLFVFRSVFPYGMSRTTVTAPTWKSSGTRLQICWRNSGRSMRSCGRTWREPGCGWTEWRKRWTTSKPNIHPNLVSKQRIKWWNKSLWWRRGRRKMSFLRFQVSHWKCGGVEELFWSCTFGFSSDGVLAHGPWLYLATR